MKKTGKTQGSGVMSGLSSHEKIKAGPECVSQQNGKNEVPVRKKEKAGRFTIT